MSSRKWREILNLGGLSAKQLTVRVYHEMANDNVSGYAAQLAYYFLFSLFPFFLFLAALLGFLPIPDLMEKILDAGGRFLPQEAMHLVRDTVVELVTNQKGGLLSFGILIALWSASGAVSAMTDSLNQAYGVKESRPFWKVRGLALLLTIVLAVLMVAASLLLIFGPHIGNLIASYVGLGDTFNIVWNIARWPVVLFFAMFSVALVYYYAPDVQQEWKWITPGSVFAVVGWILVSLGFGYYVDHFGSYNKTYGSIGAIIVLLTWMYISGFVLLLGGEINSEIEHAAPHGKAEGQKRVPRGRAAAR